MSAAAGYSGTPLWNKLSLKPAMRAALSADWSALELVVRRTNR
jgi:hypothetical protein